MRKRMAVILAAAMLAMGTFAGCGSVADADTVEIVNVSYDPTRELYQAYNTLFEKHWEEQTGQKRKDHPVPWRFRKTGIGGCERP